MFSIGLTGGIGSGKSTVADLFAARGVPLIDTDLIAHQITAPGGVAMPLIASEFGDDFIAADGSLDRAKMRALVFADDTAKARLEAHRASVDSRRDGAPAACGAGRVSHRRRAAAGRVGRMGSARVARARGGLPGRDADRARHAAQRLHARTGARDHREAGVPRSAARGSGRYRASTTKPPRSTRSRSKSTRLHARYLALASA